VAVLPLAASQWGAARSALRRVFAVADAPDPVPVTPPAAALPAGPYHLRVEGVTARWDRVGPDVFSGLSLDLRPGRRVAVVGPSGCGKSTLAALLVRFADPSAGRITLNGTDLRHLAGDDVRRVVGLMSDDPYCFDTSVAENLRLARREASDDDLAAALRRAGLLAWVESLPDGLATAVGEHGARLSGGQRRRLALARALLADTPILVLDEPTEHVDEATARAITDDLLDATTGRTVVLITHRTYGLDRVDEVVTMAGATAPSG
jgi:ABC-type multidrug transport system fused ATPase/permease subunit